MTPRIQEFAPVTAYMAKPEIWSAKRILISFFLAVMFWYWAESSVFENEVVTQDLMIFGAIMALIGPFIWDLILMGIIGAPKDE